MSIRWTDAASTVSSFPQAPCQVQTRPRLRSALWESFLPRKRPEGEPAVYLQNWGGGHVRERRFRPRRCGLDSDCRVAALPPQGALARGEGSALSISEASYGFPRIIY